MSDILRGNCLLKHIIEVNTEEKYISDGTMKKKKWAATGWS
jgi:hypothetical protein